MLNKIKQYITSLLRSLVRAVSVPSTANTLLQGSELSKYLHSSSITCSWNKT